MEIFNQTRFVPAFTQGMDKTGRDYLVLVVKGTFAFPDAGDTPAVAAEQRALVMADEYTGAPGFSAPLWETDFAFRKPRCDVIVNGAAHAPGGRPVQGLRVGIRVGAWSKTLDVIGAREWRVVGPVVTATEPHPFTKMQFTYDTAFGGPDRTAPDDPAPAVYGPNPVGLGWGQVKNQSRLSGQPLPNTQVPDEPVTSPYGNYRPMALGPIGRGWPERLKHAGTYDQRWQDEVFPFLPADFDERYFQCAPEDQQIDPPAPGGPVILGHLTPKGREAFRLPPETALPVTLFRAREIAAERTLLPDTLLFDCEARVLMMVWRISVPIRRIITEFTHAWVGPPTDAMRRARAEGRRYVRAVATAAAEPAEDEA
ncbi:DUF2169 family type VI secretion system accessory protein [Rhodovulum euryhalinum]|uniref:DUF2169 domain-containing protein n=1 Tax=Rhodovulum euryhalinum TaxID=35805 RepID=A0A4R2KKI0_9RHOB|nr:DUF2169 domain-containing protein [Rhodovulum euryhalinum]TCO70538.1 hypothetical protein EV655_10985 [Rhodovulum euryhalinum]